MTPPLRVELLPGGERAEPRRRWLELESRVGPRLVCSWDWTEVWLDHFADLVDARFAFGESDERTCACALITRGPPQRRGPLRVRPLCVGTAGVPPPDSVYVEYNALLAEPGAGGPFAASLVALLSEERGWDQLCLDGFAEADLAPFEEAGARLCRRSEVSPYADLAAFAGGDGQIVSGLSKNTRQQVRRSLRGFGEAVGEWASTTQRALEVFEELVGLHQRRWTAGGEPGAFASERVVAFHRDLIARLGPERAALFRVAAGEATVGCLYCLRERDRMLFYQGGLAPTEGPKLKPGLAAHALFMQEAFDRGVREYDFLAGEAQYKRQLSNCETTLVWAAASRRIPLRLVEWVAALRPSRG